MHFDLHTDLGSLRPMNDKTVSLEDKSSDQLIALIAQHRSREAYGVLFQRYAPKLKAFVMGQGLGPQEAEDLAQEALLNLWRKAESFDPAKASATTWIYTIARNLRIDAARKAKRVKELPEDLWQGEPMKQADDSLILHQSATALRGLMEDLPRDQRDVLRMSFYDELSHGDIAKSLNLPLGTVKSRLRLALLRLRALMSALGQSTVGEA